jgi:hypothetical protein
MRAGRTRPRGVPAPGVPDGAEDYWNDMPTAERLIRRNVEHLLRTGVPRSVVLAYLREAGGDLSILNNIDAPTPDPAQETAAE